MSGFKVGDEVVCVDDVPRAGTPYPEDLYLLDKGTVYTVSDITCRGLGVRLSGIRQISEAGFWYDRFRPVHRTKTDLSIEAFSTIKPGYEEPKRVERVKKGVGV